MLPPIATVAQVERRLGVAAGSITGTDLGRLEDALDDASALVRAESYTLTWVDDTDGTTITAPHEVVVVTIQSALRTYRNPDGYTGESVGDYSYQYGQQAGSISVYLSGAEKALVRAAAQTAKGLGFTGSVGTPSAYSTPETDTDIVAWGL